MKSKWPLVVIATGVLAVGAILLCLAVFSGWVDLSSFFQGDDTSPAEQLEAVQANVKNTSQTPSQLTLTRVVADITWDDEGVLVREELYLTEASRRLHLYVFAANYGRVSLQGIEVEGELQGFELSGTNLYVDMATEGSYLSVTYRFQPERQGVILSHTGNMVMLTHLLMTPSVRVGGSTVESYPWGFGDPFVYDMHHYHVTVHTGEHWIPYAPGQVSQSVQNGVRSAVFQASNLRDFPLVLCPPDTPVSTLTSGDTQVTYIGAATADLSPFVDSAMQFASEKIGPYPYNELFVVRAPITTNKGMEFSCMIMLADSQFSGGGGLKSLCYHEIFHQWFYGIVGVDQIGEPFVDEGIVTFLDAYLRNLDPGTASSRAFVGKGLRDYLSRSQYESLAYSDASRYYAGWFHNLGEERFFALLSRVYDQKGYGILRYEEFEAMAQAALAG